MKPEKVVLDTNVLVSGLLNSFGPPGRILDLVLVGEFSVAYDDRILGEWREVLRREKFGFPSRDVETLFDFVESEGHRISAQPLETGLPDPDDAPFLEVAYETGAVLITGNLKHYPPEGRQGVEVIEPAAFMERWLSET